MTDKEKADKRKALAKEKDRFKLHVLLIKSEGNSSSDAQFIAWGEGPAGLARRLKGGV